MADSSYTRKVRAEDKYRAEGLILLSSLWVHPDDKAEARSHARALPKTKAILDKLKDK